MSNKINALAAVAALVTTATLPGRADTTHRHGSLCAAKYASRDLVGADERGIYNGSTTATASVTCPVIDRTEEKFLAVVDGSSEAYTEVSPIHSVTVHGRDLSSTVPFSCYLFATEELGASSWGPTRYLCSSWVGCSESTTDYVGNGSIRFNVDALADVFSSGGSAHLGVVCNIPPAANGNSYVKSLEVVDSTTHVFTWRGDHYDFSLEY